MQSDADHEITPQSAPTVAKRVLALLAIVDKAHNQNAGNLYAWVAAHKICNFFSADEEKFFSDAEPSQQDIVTYSWRAEALVPLLWGLGMLEKLPPLNSAISWDKINGLDDIVSDPERFVQTAQLREKEVLDEAEANLYQQHWRVRDAQLFGKPMPEELDPGIVFERRYGASWMVGWGNDWDNVPTDT